MNGVNALEHQRHFIDWHMPGDKENGGRVELIPASNGNEPESHLARTVEEVTIPAGAVLQYVVAEDDRLSGLREALD